MEDANYSERVRQLRGILEGIFDPVSVEKSAQEAILKTIMELHPNDYNEFMQTHKTELESMGKRVISRFRDDYRKRFPGLID